MINEKKIATYTLLASIILTIIIVPMSTQQGTGTYDPWLDYNEDGTIDVNDLHPLGGAYGTTGDPTKNVNVTNWPLEHGLFPTDLVLRGCTYLELIDETMAPGHPLKDYPDAYGCILSNTRTPYYNKTFIYRKYPTHAYKIVGFPAACLTWNVTNNPSSMFVVEFEVNLLKIPMTGPWTQLTQIGTTTLSYSGQLDDTQSAWYFRPSGPLNVTVNAGELLAVRVTSYAYYLTAQTQLIVRILMGVNNDYFTVNIPIVENP